MLKKFSLILIAVLMFAACEDETVNTDPPVLDCEILGTLYTNNSDSLYLRNKGLTELPDCIGNLTGLKSLWLSNNDLTSLPESIGNLKNLLVLYSYSNQLTSLPESIGDLKNLQVLYLYNNQLSSLPESIGNLTELKYLWLQDNNISDAEKAMIESWLPNCDIRWDW